MAKERDWAKKVAKGIKLFLWFSVICPVVGIVGRVVADRIVPLEPDPIGSGFIINEGAAWVGLISFFFFVPIIVGAWSATTKPTWDVARSTERVRLTTRVFAIAYLIATLAHVIARFFPGSELLLFFNTVPNFSWWLFAFLGIGYAQDVMGRIEEKRLAYLGRMLFRLVVLAFVVVLTMYSFKYEVMRIKLGAGTSAEKIIFWSLPILFLVTGGSIVWYLLKARRAIMRFGKLLPA